DVGGAAGGDKVGHRLLVGLGNGAQHIQFVGRIESVPAFHFDGGDSLAEEPICAEGGKLSEFLLGGTARLHDGIPYPAARLGNVQVALARYPQGVVARSVARKANVGMAIDKAGEEDLLTRDILHFGRWICFGQYFEIADRRDASVGYDYAPVYDDMELFVRNRSFKRKSLHGDDLIKGAN